jgi:hypothetical protein
MKRRPSRYDTRAARNVPGKGLGHLEEQLEREKMGLPIVEPPVVSTKQRAALFGIDKGRYRKGLWMAKKMHHRKMVAKEETRRVAAGEVQIWCSDCLIRFYALPGSPCPKCKAAL